MKTLYVLIILLVILVALYICSNSKENMTSSQAVENIASVFNKNNMVVTNVKVTGDINTTGQIVGNLSIKQIAGISGEAITVNSPIILNSPIKYANNLKPSTLVVAIGDYKGPIYDFLGNTFPISKYTIKIIQNGNDYANNQQTSNVNNIIIGVRNNKWWITQFPSWNVWTWVTLEIIPIPLNDYYLSYSTHPAITQDTDNEWNNPGGGWTSEPKNNDNNSYYSFDSDGKPYRMINPVSKLS